MHLTRNLLQRRAFTAIVVLSAAASSVQAQAAAATTPKGSLRIRANGHETLLSASDLAALPHHDLRAAGENSTDSATVSGVALWDILQKAGVPPAEASGRQRAAMFVRLRADDGQTAVFALVELDPGFSRKTVLVADRRDGQALDGVEGPWRVFAPDDLRRARWIRGLVAIDVDTPKP